MTPHTTYGIRHVGTSMHDILIPTSIILLYVAHFVSQQDRNKIQIKNIVQHFIIIIIITIKYSPPGV